VNHLKSILYWTVACAIVGTIVVITVPIVVTGQVIGFAFTLLRIGFDDGQSAVCYLAGIFGARKK
jgi:hypothetical protein